MKQVAELQLAMQHKPFFAGSSLHQSFLKTSLEKTERLMREHPYLHLQEQIQFFKQAISK